jgi:hypothetical protein
VLFRFLQQPKSLSELRPDIAWPKDLQTLLAEALASDPDTRPASILEFGRAVSGVLTAWDARSPSVTTVPVAGVPRG